MRLDEVVLRWVTECDKLTLKLSGLSDKPWQQDRHTISIPWDSWMAMVMAMLRNLKRKWSVSWIIIYHSTINITINDYNLYLKKDTKMEHNDIMERWPYRSENGRSFSSFPHEVPFGPKWHDVDHVFWQMRNLFRCEHTAPRFDMTVLQCCKLIPLLEPPKKIIRKVGTEKTWSITSWMNLSVVSAGARQWNLRFLDETPTFCCFQWVKQLSGSIFGDGRRTDRWGQPQVTMAQNWCQRACNVWWFLVFYHHQIKWWLRGYLLQVEVWHQD